MYIVAKCTCIFMLNKHVANNNSTISEEIQQCTRMYSVHNNYICTLHHEEFHINTMQSNYFEKVDPKTWSLNDIFSLGAMKPLVSRNRDLFCLCGSDWGKIKQYTYELYTYDYDWIQITITKYNYMYMYMYLHSHFWQDLHVPQQTRLWEKLFLKPTMKEWFAFSLKLMWCSMSDQNYEWCSMPDQNCEWWFGTAAV